MMSTAVSPKSARIGFCAIEAAQSDSAINPTSFMAGCSQLFDLGFVRRITLACPFSGQITTVNKQTLCPCCPADRLGPPMKRRQFVAIAPLAAAVCLVGCDDTPKPSSTASLTNSDQIKSAVDELDSLAGTLEEDAENFDGNNWREVVPDVKEHIESLRGAVDNLMQALGYKS